MNKTAYETLTKSPSTTLCVSDVSPEKPRTLLWGYTLERNSFHVYVKDGLIHILKYQTTKTGPQVLSYVSGDSVSAYAVIPSKRLYPEACDEQVCRILLRMGMSLPFTTFDETRPEAQYHGLTFEDIPQPCASEG